MGIELVSEFEGLALFAISLSDVQIPDLSSNEHDETNNKIIIRKIFII